MEFGKGDFNARFEYDILGVIYNYLIFWGKAEFNNDRNCTLYTYWILLTISFQTDEKIYDSYRVIVNIIMSLMPQYNYFEYHCHSNANISYICYSSAQALAITISLVYVITGIPQKWSKKCSLRTWTLKSDVWN